MWIMKWKSAIFRVNSDEFAISTSFFINSLLFSQTNQKSAYFGGTSRKELFFFFFLKLLRFFLSKINTNFSFQVFKNAMKILN